jgi:hypothetical protein
MSLLFINHVAFGQSKSRQELCNSLVNSIKDKNLDAFKALLLPREVAFELYENGLSEDIGKEERDSQMTQYQSVYENTIVPRYEKNFWDIVNLSTDHHINWSNLDFFLLYKYESKIDQYDPYLIHSRLSNADYKHFYINAVRYKDAWYLEDKMEITRGEKYAAK